MVDSLLGGNVASQPERLFGAIIVGGIVWLYITYLLRKPSP
jgi:hypothetical protein